jgi:transposase
MNLLSKKGQGNFATIVTDLDKSSLTEICNYFNNRTTSGVTEGLNTKIKLIVRQSYGFKNFDAMKEKLALLGLWECGKTGFRSRP